MKQLLVRALWLLISFLGLSRAHAIAQSLQFGDSSTLFAKTRASIETTRGYANRAQYDSAMQSSYQLRKEIEAYPTHPLFMQAALQYAEILRTLGRFREAIQVINQAIAFNNQKDRLAEAYNRLAGIYYEINFQDSTRYFTNLSSAIIQPNQNNLKFKNAWMRGALELNASNYTEAIKQLKAALEHMPEDELENRNVIMNHLGVALMEGGRKQEGMDMLRLALEDAKKNGNLSQRTFAAKSYFRYKMDLYRNAESHQLFNEFLQYNDSLIGRKQASNISLLETREELVRQQERNAALTLKATHQAAKERLMILVGIAVLLLTTVLGVFYATARRQKRRIANQNAILSAQQHELELKQRALEQLNNSKDALLSVVSHDVRGPLLTLGSMLQLLADGHLTEEETKTILKGLAERVQDTETLLNDVLLWTKGNMKGLHAEEALINPQTIVNEVLVQCRPLLQTHQVDARVEGTPTPYMGDVGFTKVIIRNLLSNAIRHGARPGTVYIHYVANDREAGVSIRDLGKGMPKELVERLMDAEVDLGLPTRSALSLGGLGLVLVKDFVLRQNGRIHVESSINGTAITVWMKRGQASSPKPTVLAENVPV